MIIVRVELHSAITGKITEIARMGIANIGGTRTRGDYSVKTYRGRSAEELNRRVPERSGQVTNYPRLAIHVWHLVARALLTMNYTGERPADQQSDMLDAAP